LPDFINIDITEMKIGNKKYVRDLRVDQYEIMHPDSVVVCMIKTSRTAVADTDGEDVEAGEVPSGQAENEA
jgi:large subunit ribosomal protein L25